ncbi:MULTISPECIES: hypothetical protein [unclassified Streptomyces]|uniref:hypothetical protein n=1 Tax=unclassified Streptomyces TaxID=2593676 RepID=UPI003424B954
MSDTPGAPAGELTGSGFDRRPSALRAEFEAGAFNGRVGQRLLSETDRVRVREIRLAPGERVPAHRHVLDVPRTRASPPPPA